MCRPARKSEEMVQRNKHLTSIIHRNQYIVKIISFLSFVSTPSSFFISLSSLLFLSQSSLILHPVSIPSFSVSFSLTLVFVLNSYSLSKHPRIKSTDTRRSMYSNSLCIAPAVAIIFQTFHAHSNVAQFSSENEGLLGGRDQATASRSYKPQPLSPACHLSLLGI